MKPYFESKERQEELFNILESWIGTPHKHLVAVKGLGADCALYAWEVMKEIKAMGNDVRNIPMKSGHIDYPSDRASHSTEEVLLKVLRGVHYLKELDKNSRPMNGDICTYQLGKSTAHLSIYYDGRIYHSLMRSGVKKTRFDDKFFKSKLSAIFRVMEQE